MPAPEIPGYELREALGRAGSTETFRAVDARGHGVVVKIFRPSAADAIVGFASRALSCVRLRSAHIAPLRDRGKTADLLYAVRDRFDAEPLSARVSSLAAADALHIALQLGTALEHAHLHGLVHGAVKPENVLFDAAQSPVLVDVALLPNAVNQQFAPPEQATSVAHDPSVDQYALAQLTRWLLAEATRDPHAPFVDAQLSAAIERASAITPQQRFRRVGELVSEIDAAHLRAARDARPSVSSVQVKLVDRTVRVSVTGTWTPQAVETCTRDIAAAMQGGGALAIGYVLEAHGGCHSAAIDTLSELHRRHRGQLRRVGFVSESPQARGASVLIGTRVAGLDWKTFASVDRMDAWLREVGQ